MVPRAEPLLQHLRRLIVPPDQDAVLLERFVRCRDEAAFAALIARHGPMVMRVCRRILGATPTAEDAFQATLLALAQQAASIRQGSAVAAWLHGVAYRVACKARAAESQRRAAEALTDRLAPADPRPDPLALLTARELLTVVDEELQRLPQRYRLPVILCCLEGYTQQEAAEVLGWTPGSVKGRLERGRKQLHARLLRRGLTLPAALAAVEVARAAEAAVPAAMVHAVLRSASGKPTDGVALTAEVIALAEGVKRPMLLTKRIIVVGVMFAAALAVVGSGVLAQWRPAEEQGARAVTTATQAAKPDAIQPPAPQPPDKAKDKPVAADRTWDVAADAVQPAGSPVLLTITMTNTSKQPLAYWCGGPSMGYPAVVGVKVQVADEAGKTQQLSAFNGQYLAGSGLMVAVQPGAAVKIPAVLPPLPRGTYTIRIGDGRSARVTVKDDPELLSQREKDLLARAGKGEPFAQHAIAAHLSPSLERKLLEDLAAEERDVAWQAAQTLYKVERLRAEAVPALTRAMNKQLALELARKDRQTNVLVYLVSIASRTGAEEAMEPLLTLAKSTMGGGARAEAVAWMGMFQNERATRELYHFLKDAEADVRFAAARALAERKDPAGIEVLVAAARDSKSPWRDQACRALVHFPDDPRAERAIVFCVEDPQDPTVRDGAKIALEQLRLAKKK
jgi:RNA polymerase sigma factor (sigma-70 family)